MRIGPLTLFNRMHSNGVPTSGITVAAIHWRNSITWRWAMHFSWGGSVSRRIPVFTFQRTHRGEGINFHSTLRLPLGCGLSFQTQPNMWRKR